MPRAVRQVVDFWYTGQLEFGAAAESGGARGVQEVADLVIAADYLQAWKGVADACQDRLLHLLGVDTWWRIWEMCGHMSMDVMKAAVLEKVDAFATVRINECSRHRSWAQAPAEAVAAILAKLSEDVASEDALLAAALNWASLADGTPLERAAQLAGLLTAVRLPRVSREALRKLSKHPLLQASQVCTSLLTEALLWEDGAPEARPEWAPRPPRVFSGVVTLDITFGGTMQRFEEATGRWTNLPDRPEEDVYTDSPTLAALNGSVYVMGGWNDGNYTSRVIRLDLLAPAGEWREAAPLLVARGGVAAASLQGYLYVSGGSNLPAYHALLERYSDERGCWERMGDMAHPRTHHKMVALGGMLYVLGGLTNFGEEIFLPERYNPVTNSWAPIASMDGGVRLDFAVAAMGGCIYVSGGIEAMDHEMSSARCGRYDPALNEWSRIADLPLPVCRHAMACLNGALYVLGGHSADGAFMYHDPWRYDPVQNAWAHVRVGSSADMREFRKSTPM